MAEALEDGVVTDAADVAGYHHAIRRETERFSALVDDLFELARIEGGALTDVPFVPLHDLVSELVDAAAVRAGAADVRPGSSDARRGGTAGVRTVRPRWSPSHKKKKKNRK